MGVSCVNTGNTILINPQGAFLELSSPEGRGMRGGMRDYRQIRLPEGGS